MQGISLNSYVSFRMEAKAGSIANERGAVEGMCSPNCCFLRFSIQKRQAGIDPSTAIGVTGSSGD